MKIAILFDPKFAQRPFDPDRLWTDSRGLTGSEMAAFMFGRELAAQGHSVTIISNFPREGTVFGCSCRDWDTNIHYLAREHWDVAIAVIMPTWLEPFNARLKIFNQQISDFNYCRGWEAYTDILAPLSHSHVAQLRKHTVFPTERIHIVPNGCDPPTEEELRMPRRPHHLIYASSPDRGLHRLLECWPLIRKAVPDATLDVFYDFDFAYNIYHFSPNAFGYRMRYIKECLSRLENHGVSLRKSISRVGIRREMLSSRILAYPCDVVMYIESFSVTTLEAAALGCPPVIVGADALVELYSEYVPTLPTYNKEQYVALIVRHLTDDSFYGRSKQMASLLGPMYTWRKSTTCLLDVISKQH